MKFGAVVLLILTLNASNVLSNFNNTIYLVDGINHTCGLYPNCKVYIFESSVVLNIERNTNYMGSLKCCYNFQSSGHYKKVLIRLLMPSQLYGDDSIEIYNKDLTKLITRITANDTVPYRDILIDDDDFILTFTKDRLSLQSLDILVLAYNRMGSSGCDKEDDFECVKDRRCFDKYLVCDKYPQCSDSTDEYECTNSSTKNPPGARPNSDSLIAIVGAGFLSFFIIFAFVILSLYCFTKKNSSCCRPARTCFGVIHRRGSQNVPNVAQPQPQPRSTNMRCINRNFTKATDEDERLNTRAPVSHTGASAPVTVNETVYPLLHNSRHTDQPAPPSYAEATAKV